MLEPYDGKLSRTVLRGERGGNAPDLPDPFTVINQERLRGEVGIQGEGPPTTPTPKAPKGKGQGYKVEGQFRKEGSEFYVGKPIKIWAMHTC